MTTDVTFNNVALSTAVPEAMVLEVARGLLGARQNVRVTIPGRAGSISFPDQPGDRTLQLQLDIAADTYADRRAAVVALAGWLDLDAPAQLVLDDEPDRYWVAMLDSSPDVFEWLCTAATRVSLICEPYAYALAPTVVEADLTGGADEIEVTFVDDVDADPVIELTADGGTITAWTLTIGDDSLSWSGLIGDGDTITVSTISHTVTTGASIDTELTGAFDSTDVDMATVAGRWPSFTADSTPTVELEWTGTAPTVAARITWRRRYR